MSKNLTADEDLPLEQTIIAEKDSLDRLKWRQEVFLEKVKINSKLLNYD